MTTFFKDIWTQKKAIPVFLALAFFYASSYFQRTAIPGTTFQFFQADYGMTAAQIAGLSASMVYIYAFCQPVVGLLADKFSGIRIVICAGLIFCIGVALFPFSCGNLCFMYICRALTGLGASALYLSSVKEIDRIFGRKNYSVMLGIVYFIGYAGGLFGTWPLAVLCKHYNWNHLLIIVGTISVILYLIFFGTQKAIPLPPIAPQKLSLKPLWGIIKNPLIWAPLFCSSVNFACHSIIQMVFGIKF